MDHTGTNYYFLYIIIMKTSAINTYLLIIIAILLVWNLFFVSNFGWNTSETEVVSEEQIENVASQEDREKELYAFNDLFNDYAKNNDVESIVSLYDEEALWIAPRTPPVTGKQAPRETFWFLVASEGSISHTIDHLFISDDGSQAVMIWDAIVLAEKAGLDFTGTYKFVLERRGDSWKIVSDMFNQHIQEDVSVN